MRRKKYVIAQILLTAVSATVVHEELPVTEYSNVVEGGQYRNWLNILMCCNYMPCVRISPLCLTTCIGILLHEIYKYRYDI